MSVTLTPDGDLKHDYQGLLVTQSLWCLLLFHLVSWLWFKVIHNFVCIWQRQHFQIKLVLRPKGTTQLQTSLCLTWSKCQLNDGESQGSSLSSAMEMSQGLGKHICNGFVLLVPKVLSSQAENSFYKGKTGQVSHMTAHEISLPNKLYRAVPQDMNPGSSNYSKFAWELLHRKENF